MGKSKRKSSGGLRTIFSLVTLILALAALAMLALPVVTATKDPFTISATGFAFAFGGEWQIVTKAGSLTTNNTASLELQTGMLILFILLALAVLLMVANLLFCLMGKKKTLVMVTGGFAFLLLIAAGVMFFMTKSFILDAASLKIGSYTIDFRDYLNLASGAIIGGIAAIVGGVGAAATIVVR